jgi:2-polyprenyl-6-methoxyphenol hydroxylase-like FAD-dependent oxidoreductase
MEGTGTRARTVAVVGGGLGGCGAAIGLAGIGLDVSVFEAAPAVRLEGESISLLSNGTSALAALGVAGRYGHRIARLEFLARRGDGRALTHVDTAEIERRTGFPYVVIPRAEMLQLLIERLQVPISYGKRCVGISASAAGAEISFADGTSTAADLVVAADGTRSVLREALWPEDQSKAFSTAWQGTVAMPSDYGEPQVAVVVPGPGLTTGAFPTTTGRVAFFVESRTGLSDTTGQDDRSMLLRELAAEPGPLRALVERSDATGIRRDEVYLRPPPRRRARRGVFLVADAAHTLSPSVGQGTNLAFEDAVALALAIRDHEDLESAGRAYSRSRQRRAKALWRLAKLSTDPVMGRFNELMIRILPPSATTAGWLRLTVRPRLCRRCSRSLG